jgi:hypothetical protein
MASRGNPFTLDSDGDATLRLQVPSKCVEQIVANMGWLFGGSFIVRIERLDAAPSDLPKS